MTACAHEFQLGMIEANGECIVSVKCANCDVLATAAGKITDFGGSYSEITAFAPPTQ